jgi:transposase
VSEGVGSGFGRAMLRAKERPPKRGRADAGFGSDSQKHRALSACHREHHTRLARIHGIDRVIAATIIAELGTDMSVFKSAAHLAAWAGVCPGNNESAGKRKRGPTRRGNVHLMTALVEAAHGASSKRGSYLRDKFHWLKARRGYQRAAVAIAHKIVGAVYVMLSTGAE